MLALCSAELGYQYQQGDPGLGYETDTQQTGDHYQDHADFHKHFYAFEAPYDSDEEVEQVEQKIIDVAQKNLQVVFIKAPENKAVQGALNALTKQSSEDKTAIFVLNKQTDSNELASKLSAVQAHHKHKPEVHFVKYRTDAEAARAQQHIQEQYAAAAALPQQPLPPSPLGYLQSAYVLGKDSKAAQAYSTLQSSSSSSSSSSASLGYTQTSYTVGKEPQAVESYTQLPSSSATSSSLGYSQPAELPAQQVLPALPAYYAQQSLAVQTPEQPLQQSYYPAKETTAQPAYYPQVAAPVELPPKPYSPPVEQALYPQESALQPPAPHPSYLPPTVSNFVTPPPISYNPGLIDLPPVPLVEQQLAPSPYDLDARTARSRHIDFRVNERHRAGSRITFPTSTPARSYLPPISRSYLPPQKRRRRANA